jgi:hypothetical protein
VVAAVAQKVEAVYQAVAAADHRMAPALLVELVLLDKAIVAEMD